MVLDIARRKYPFDIGGCGVSLKPAAGANVAVFHVELPLEYLGIGAMANCHEDSGDLEVFRTGNVDSVNHAESVLAREAARRFDTDTLWRCTLVTTVEPCAMCAGTQYWAHIGRLVYGMTERRLLELTGNHAENPTLDLPCREVFARGQKAVEVIGPVVEVEDEIAALHRGFWRR